MPHFILFLLAWLVSPIYAWTPIASVRNLDQINSIKIQHQEYVIWKTPEKRLVVQQDICPYDFAPLSEGRLLKSHIQCNYDGKVWNEKGEPSHAENIFLKTYATYETGDILWVDFSEKNASMLMIQKENMTQIPYVRNIQCSWNFFLEYCLSMKHFPKSVSQSHLLQMNKDGVSFFMETESQEDIKVDYISPYLFQVSDRSDNTWKCIIQMLCIPVAPGQTKVILCEKQNKSTTQRLQDHEYYNKIFQDMEYMLHKQEINYSKSLLKPKLGGQNAMEKIFKKWMNRYYSKWVSFSIHEKPKSVVTDHDLNHFPFCKDCRQNRQS